MREFGQKKAAGAIILVLALAAFAFGLDLAIDKILYEKEDEIPEGLFLLEEGKDSDIFTDLTEGYRIEVPKGCSVDMRYSSVRALLEGKDANIEIYSQELSGDETAESYHNYSNSFLSAGFDNVVYDGEAECDFENASLLIWDRERLPGKTGARSHYASIDIPVYGEAAEKADKNDDGETAEKAGKNDGEKKAVKVYTIMIKSETPLTTDSAIIRMAENFSLLDEDEMTALTGSPEGAEAGHLGQRNGQCRTEHHVPGHVRPLVHEERPGLAGKGRQVRPQLPVRPHAPGRPQRGRRLHRLGRHVRLGPGL